LFRSAVVSAGGGAAGGDGGQAGCHEVQADSQKAAVQITVKVVRPKESITRL